MSERDSTLGVVARFCISASVVVLIVMVNVQGCSIRDLQRRIAILEQGK